MNKGVLKMHIARRGRADYTPSALSGARVARVVTSQSIVGSGADVYAVWDTVVYDTDHFVDLANSPTRITFWRGGWYSVGANADVNAGGATGARIRIDYGTQAAGSAAKKLAHAGMSAPSGEITHGCHATSFFNPGDYIELALEQFSGVNKNYGGAGTANEFTLCLFARRVG